MNLFRRLSALFSNQAPRRLDQPAWNDQADPLLSANPDRVRVYSQRVSPPFCGQVQIIESARARALTLDGAYWEIQYVQTSVVPEGPGAHRPERRFRHIDKLPHSEITRIASGGQQNGQPVDERIVELARHISDAALPFPANDHYEYWLLDASDGSPLAFIFSCADPGDIQNLPIRPEWTALPAAVMPITKTDTEVAQDALPVNYRFERLIAERAGPSPRARWFRRSPDESESFPPLLVREDWQERHAIDLCQRYLQRQATRLLMLHGLARDVRLRLEQAVRPNLTELVRFHGLYPEIVNQELMTAMRVEARLRAAASN